MSEGSQKKGEAESKVRAEWICSRYTFLEVHFGVIAASKLSELNAGLNNWNVCKGWSVSSALNHGSVLYRERTSLPDRDT